MDRVLLVKAFLRREVNLLEERQPSWEFDWLADLGRGRGGPLVG